MQPVEMVREMVSVSHGNMKRVRELVEAHPSLAKASWDWGFGDWEAAIDAASHVGNREIAEYLIGKGARPTLFTAAMLGQLEVVKGLIAAHPGVQRCAGPHSISLLAHARNGGSPAKEVYQYLESLGDAGSPAAAPITDEELISLAGTYSFGGGATEQIEIKSQQGSTLCLRGSRSDSARAGPSGRSHLPSSGGQRGADPIQRIDLDRSRPGADAGGDENQVNGYLAAAHCFMSDLDIIAPPVRAVMVDIMHSGLSYSQRSDHDANLCDTHFSP